VHLTHSYLIAGLAGGKARPVHTIVDGPVHLQQQQQQQQQQQEQQQQEQQQMAM
jgi:hypothetical protein